MTDLGLFLLLVLVASLSFLIYVNYKARTGKGIATAYRKHGLFSGSKNGAYYEFTAENGKTYTAFLSNWSSVHRSESVTVQYDTDNPRHNRIIG